jgi:hypothetical protein
MNFLKVLPILILTIFLFNGVAAVTTYASFGTGEDQSATIINGQSTSFSIDFFTMSSPMNLKVQLYDSSDNLIHTFLSQSVNAKEYTATYTIDKSIYGTVGDYTVILNGADAHSSQSHELTLKVNPDTTAPVITLKGNNPQSITKGNSYVEEGATATDNIDGDLSSKITIDSSAVKINTVGSYTVSYSVSDNSGNTASATRTVKVVPIVDTTAPVITLNGANPQSIVKGHAYTELGATASDDIDGDVTSNIIINSSAVNVNIVGTYSVSYSVSDNAGNIASATRTVKVVASGTDTTAPVVTITSPTNGSIYNSASRDLIFTATDTNLNLCSYSTDNGVTKISTSCSSGTIETISLTASEGTNTWIVYASDVAGNKASASVTFTVDTSIVDITPPVITITSPTDNEVINSRSFGIELTTDEDATVTLSLDDGSSKTMSNSVDHRFTYILNGLSNGEHTLKFTATDTAGNVATKTITFTVHKRSSSGSSGTITEVPTSETPATNPIVLPQGDVKILDDVSLTKKISFFQNIINAISNFFKKLFGIK